MVFVILFALTALLVQTGKADAIDAPIQAWIFSLRMESLTAFEKIVTLGGDTKVVGVICIVLIILPKRLQIGLPIALITGVGAAIQQGIKAIVERPRPDMINWLVEEDGFSFPSGHTNASLILYVAIAIIFGRWLILHGQPRAAAVLRTVLPMFAFLIALSRPYLGVHYPTDIFGGWMLGGALLILLFSLYERFWPAKWRLDLS
ncbi:MAG: phosphatase PAP2 family protein [Clostridiales Family XIII bacterium]|nr:phosphatase PAP2 family protein [Clostridiales Family XIII bacterium]